MKSSFVIRLAKFLALWIALSIFFCFFNNSFEKYPILIQSVNALLFTIGFYFSYHFLIIPFLYKGKTIKFIALYLLFIAVLSAISMVSTYQIYILQGNKFYINSYWSEPVFFTSNYVLMLLVTSTLLSFRFLKDRMQTQLQLENIEKEKISTELSFLKAQINPHFLFNSLNNILFQIDKSNHYARETLLKFSDMLRYQLYDCSAEYIEIEKELQYIRNYIEIQLLRKTDKYSCDIYVDENVCNFSIAPLLLIPFIENAFKHISHHAGKKNLINVKMNFSQNTFHFEVTNDKEVNLPEIVSENRGIGLVNVKRRLDLLYKDSYQLSVNDSDDLYKVSLDLKISK